MELELLAGTDDGVAVVDVDDVGHAQIVARGLEGLPVTCVAGNGDIALAGTRDHGLYRSLDGARTWSRAGSTSIVSDRVTAVALGPSGGLLPRLYAGTEPSRLYVSDDVGDTWIELEALQQIPSRDQWSFPPRPWTHHVRTIAPHPRDPMLLLVGIELGGLMRSTDGGRTFQDHQPGAHRDTHQIVWDPAGRVCVEAGGTGAARLEDPADDEWHDATTGLDETYVWATAIDPADPGRWYVAAAHGPFHAHVDTRSSDAVIERHTTGGNWERIDPAADGGTSQRMQVMPYALVVPRLGPHDLVAGMRDGTLLTRDGHARWQVLEPGLAPITSLAALAGG